MVNKEIGLLRNERMHACAIHGYLQVVFVFVRDREPEWYRDVCLKPILHVRGGLGDPMENTILYVPGRANLRISWRYGTSLFVDSVIVALVS